MTEKGFLYSFLTERSNLINVIVIAIIAGIGASFLSAFTIESLKAQLSYILYLGILFCFLSIFYIFFILFRVRAKSIKFEGSVIVDSIKKEMIPLDRYRLSEDMDRYLQAALVENPDIKQIWNTSLEKLKIPPTVKNESLPSSIDSKSPYFDRPNKKLVQELVQYCVLEKISITLTDYFNDDSYRDDLIKTMKRENIPDLLLENRFLSLFSRPMNERAAFSTREHSENVVGAGGSGGALFSRFDLRLPVKSKLRKIDKNHFRIESKKLDLDIVIKYMGVDSLLPMAFYEYYLGENLARIPRNILVKGVDLEFKVTFKFGALISRTGWQYYKWIDVLFEEFNRYFSIKNYFQFIGWETAATVIECIKKLNAHSQTENKSKDEH